MIYLGKDNFFGKDLKVYYDNNSGSYYYYDINNNIRIVNCDVPIKIKSYLWDLIKFNIKECVSVGCYKFFKWCSILCNSTKIR